MFSGIIEARSNITKINQENDVVRILLSRPQTFDDIKNGDSICTNGVCLTVEKFNEQEIQFCLGIETLQVLGSSFELWKKNGLNLERSIRFGDRIHGHLVTGHVDSLAEVVRAEAEGECWFIDVKVKPEMQKYFWEKGSVCLNGVSLTVNKCVNGVVSVCLIPETIKLTNLSSYKVGEYLSLESDYLAKAYLNIRGVNG